MAVTVNILVVICLHARTPSPTTYEEDKENVLNREAGLITAEKWETELLCYLNLTILLALQWVLPLHFRGYNYKVIISAILP
jgi:hypothetical protein